MRRASLLGTLVALAASSLIFVSVAAAASPAVSTGNASAITNTGATVSGTVNPNGLSTQYAFQYGPSNRFGFQTTLTLAGSGTSTDSVSSTIGSLQSGTTYYYRIIAINSDGTTTGGTHTFKTTGPTPPPPVAKPVVSTGAALSSVNTAVLSGTVNPNGFSTRYRFEFGPTAAYGYQTAPVSIGSGKSVINVTRTLTALQSGQTYHFRIVAYSSQGTTVGADATFMTQPTGSRLAPFGHTSFVAPNFVGGIFIGCIGQTNCTAGMKVYRSDKLIAQRRAFYVNANDGGIVHYTINSTGRGYLRSSHHLNVTVVVTPVGGTSVTTNVTLVPFT
ncbi:MAG: hypothetical protein JO179_10100 [Solirubrobacterales bacterium]|nr:hypothetical protein [Solirubrobacterales bacterium]